MYMNIMKINTVLQYSNLPLTINVDTGDHVGEGFVWCAAVFADEALGQDLGDGVPLVVTQAHTVQDQPDLVHLMGTWYR